MTTKTFTDIQATTDLASIALAALIGIGLIFIAGFAKSEIVHDAAHDQRHAIAFPCH